MKCFFVGYLTVNLTVGLPSSKPWFFIFFQEMNLTVEAKFALDCCPPYEKR